MTVKVQLSKDSVVDKRTGVVETPSEYLSNLRQVELGITHIDGEIAVMKADLKAARDRREKLVGQLRAGVRDGEVLPLLEIADSDDADSDDTVDDLDLADDE